MLLPRISKETLIAYMHERALVRAKEETKILKLKSAEENEGEKERERENCVIRATLVISMH